jgi:hypothetical protein
MCSILGLVFLLVVVDECSIAVFLVELLIVQTISI